MAFGAHGGASHLEIWSIEGNKFGKQWVVNAGITSALLHLDWSSDSSCIILDSEAYELEFVMTETQPPKVASASACKDMDWHTWTCKLGWPVMGVFPDA